MNVFWELRYEYTEYNNDGEYIDTHEVGPYFFATMEECLAYVADAGIIDLDAIHINRRSMSTCRKEYILNNSNR